MARNSKADETRCASLNRRGSPCGAPRVTGSTLCVYHDPASAPKLAEGRKRGGLNSHPRPPVFEIPEVSLESPRDFMLILADAINQVRQNRMDQKRATALGYLVGIALKVRDATETHERLARLEALLSTVKP